MRAKIKLSIVDDDSSIHDILQHFIQRSDMAEIKYAYTNPQKFIDEAPGLDFDMCLLDISMPGLDGITVAQLLGNKPVVFITGSDDKLRQAIDLNPVDIVTKPFNYERIVKALTKAGVKSIDYGLFNIAESKKKVSIHLPDILFVATDEIDARNKVVVLKDGMMYTLMNYSLGDILKIAPHMVQVNRHELISIDIIKGVKHGFIAIKEAASNMPKEITLTHSHKEELAKRIFYKGIM